TAMDGRLPAPVDLAGGRQRRRVRSRLFGHADEPQRRLRPGSVPDGRSDRLARHPAREAYDDLGAAVRPQGDRRRRARVRSHQLRLTGPTLRTTTPMPPPTRSDRLDAIDLRILAALQEDGRLTNVELARRVNLSPSPCLARVKALEKRGLIRGYVALCDPLALGLSLNVFISVSLERQRKDALETFEQRVSEHPEVMEC